MKKIDHDKVLGEQPWWYIMYYLALINTTYFWRKLRGKG
jgi:hypothetical protein